MSSLTLDSSDQVDQTPSLIRPTVPATSPRAIPEQESERNSGNVADEPQSPIDIVRHQHKDEDIPSIQKSPSPDEDWSNEKAQAHQVDITIRKTEANSSVSDLATGTNKQGTWFSVKTDASRKPALFSFAEEKLRIRTSSHDPSSQIVQWGIDWHQPSYMLGLFTIGLLGMICHHVYNSKWNGRLAGDPQWIQRFGTAFSYFNQVCMVGAANIAYQQLVWLTVKKRDYTIKTLDGMFSICTNPLSYLNFELLFKATIPAILAAIVWCLPLCAIVSPSTLTSVSRVRQKVSNCTAIPTFDFQKENGINENDIFIPGQGVSFFNLDPNDNLTFWYDGPSADLQKIQTLSLLSSSPLILPNPCEGGVNCTWTFSFDGPTYDCQERDEFDNSTGLTKDMLLPTGTNIYMSTSTGSENDIGQPPFWDTETRQNYSNIGTFLMEPTMWIGFVYNTTEFLGSNQTWPYRLDPHILECTLYNSTYIYNMSFSNGVMNVNNLTNKLIAPALPSGSSYAPTDQNYEAFSAYHGAGFLFRTTLSGNITQPTFDHYAELNSKISETSLVEPDIGFPAPDFPTQLVQQFSNTILSLASYPSFYSQVNISGPCTMTVSVLQWDYQPFWLALSYGLAAFATLIAVGIGLYTFRVNGYAADTNFSTFLNTTRNPSLDRLSQGYCLGQTPLPKDFMGLKLRFGEIAGFDNEGFSRTMQEEKEHLAFGLAHETRDVVFGKKYA